MEEHPEWARPDYFADDSTLAGVMENLKRYPVSYTSRVVAENAPTLGYQVITALTAGPLAAGVVMGEMAGGESYSEAKKAGLSENKALTLGVVRGTIEGSLEKLGLDAVLGKGVSSTLGERFARNFMADLGVRTLTEATTEGLQEIAANAIAKSYNEDQKLWENVWASSFAGAVLGGGLSATAMGPGRTNILPASANVQEVPKLTPAKVAPKATNILELPGLPRAPLATPIRRGGSAILDQADSRRASGVKFLDGSGNVTSNPRKDTTLKVLDLRTLSNKDSSVYKSLREADAKTAFQSLVGTSDQVDVVIDSQGFINGNTDKIRAHGFAFEERELQEILPVSPNIADVLNKIGSAKQMQASRETLEQTLDSAGIAIPKELPADMLRLEGDVDPTKVTEIMQGIQAGLVIPPLEVKIAGGNFIINPKDATVYAAYQGLGLPVPVTVNPIEFLNEAVRLYGYDSVSDYFARREDVEAVRSGEKLVERRGLQARERGKKINEERAKRQFEQFKFLRDLDVKYKVQQSIITPQGKEAFGRYFNRVIDFVENPDITTVPHEALHAYMDLVLSQDEKKAVLEYARRKHSMPNETWGMVEEKVAQDFAEWYVANKDSDVEDKSIPALVLRAWRKFRDFIRSFFRLDNTDPLSRLYEDVSTGRKTRPENRLTADEYRDRANEVERFQESFEEDPFDEGLLTLRVLKMPFMQKSAVGKQEVEQNIKNALNKVEISFVTDVLNLDFPGSDKVPTAELERALLARLLGVNIEAQDAWGDYGVDRVPGLEEAVTKTQTYVVKTPFRHGYTQNDEHFKVDEGGVFGHFRMAMVGDTAKVLEVQSDPFQEHDVRVMTSDDFVKDWSQTLENSKEYLQNIETGRKVYGFIATEVYPEINNQITTSGSRNLSDADVDAIMARFSKPEMDALISASHEARLRALGDQSLPGQVLALLTLRTRSTNAFRSFIKNAALDLGAKHPGLEMEFVDSPRAALQDGLAERTAKISELEALIEGAKNGQLPADNQKMIEMSAKFAGYKQTWHELLMRLAVNTAAREGATKIQFPTAFTATVIQGWDKQSGQALVSTDENTGPVETGQEITMYGDKFIVLDVDSESFTAAPKDDVIVFENLNQMKIEDIEERPEFFEVPRAVEEDLRSGKAFKKTQSLLGSELESRKFLVSSTKERAENMEKTLSDLETGKEKLSLQAFGFSLRQELATGDMFDTAQSIFAWFDISDNKVDFLGTERLSTTQAVKDNPKVAGLSDSLARYVLESVEGKVDEEKVRNGFVLNNVSDAKFDISKAPPFIQTAVLANPKRRLENSKNTLERDESQLIKAEEVSKNIQNVQAIVPRMLGAISVDEAVERAISGTPMPEADVQALIDLHGFTEEDVVSFEALMKTSVANQVQDIAYSLDNTYLDDRFGEWYENNGAIYVPAGDVRSFDKPEEVTGNADSSRSFFESETNFENPQIEDDRGRQFKRFFPVLNREYQGIAYRYERVLPKYLASYRGKANSERVVDEFGMSWYETAITEKDQQAVEAFQIAESIGPTSDKKFANKYGKFVEKQLARVPSSNAVRQTVLRATGQLPPENVSVRPDKALKQQMRRMEKLSRSVRSELRKEIVENLKNPPTKLADVVRGLVNPNEGYWKEKKYSESQMLKASLKAQVRSARSARREASREAAALFSTKQADIADIKRKITTYAKTLPLSERGKLLDLVRLAKNQQDLAKAYARIDNRVRAVEKAELVEAIKNQFEKVIKSPSIDAKYRAQVGELFNDLLLEGRSEKTIARIQALRDYLGRNPTVGTPYIPFRLYEAVLTLGKRPIKLLETQDLESLLEQMTLLARLGKTKRRLMQNSIAMQKENILAAVIQEAVNLDVEFDEDKKDTIKENSLRVLKNAYRKMNQIRLSLGKALRPMDVFFDMASAGNGSYSTNFHRMFKGRIDDSYGRYLIEKDLAQKPIEDMVKNLGLNPENLERIGLYAHIQQEGGMDKLLQLGYTQDELANIQLSDNEIQLYKAIMETFDRFYPRVKEYMGRVYNKDVGKVANYFPMVTDFEAMSDLEVFERFGTPQEGGKQKKNIISKSTIERKKNAKQKVRLNALDVFKGHTDNVAYMLHMGETSKILSEVAADKRFAESFGQYNTLVLRQYLDLVARQGGIDHGQKIQFLDVLRRNISTGILGFKLSSILVQPSSFFDGAALIGPTYASRGATAFATDKAWREFLTKEFPEYKARVGNDPGFKELLDTEDKLKAVREMSMSPLQTLDSWTAGSITIGAYLRYLEEKGIPLDLSFPNQDAINYAQLMMRRTQASPFFKDQPLAMSAGALTGNRSVDRMILTFQSFALNRWSMINYDVYEMMKNNPKGAANAVLWMTVSSMSAVTLRMAAKAVMSSFGGEGEEDDFMKNMTQEAIGTVPFVGSIIQSAEYGSFPVPLIAALKNLGQAFRLSYAGASPESRAKARIRFVSGAGQLFGVPGSLQAQDLILRALYD